ncbi:fimbrillin family protein [Alistipes ihumii]|uniref:fimbrillin family protein n=1 Tax=Alistipes ihumii TaxID=1470347 RepID=UPI002666BF4A|nr:fimbrillin family protein [Alistipes ihumii]
MKRFLFFLAAAAMTACSQDETTDVVGNGHPIDFRTAMGTRAAETTTGTLQKITVMAIDAEHENYFTDVEFSKKGNYFTSETPYYWPVDGSQLSFFAYAPTATELGSGSVEITNASKKLTNYAPATDVSEQQDFITATATGSKTDEAKGVALTFKHRLSQIEIKAKNTEDTYVYKVQGVRIAQPVSKATFDFGTGAWELGSDKATYEVTYKGSEKTLGSSAVSIMKTDGDNAMLIPQQLVAWDSGTDKSNAKKGAYLSVLINITKADGEDPVYPAEAGQYGWAAVAIDTNWEAGKKYVYTLDFSNGAGKVDPEDPDHPGEDILGSPIKFSVEVDTWKPADDPSGDIEM